MLAISFLQDQAELTIPKALESENLVSKLFKEDEKTAFNSINNLIWLTNEILNVKHKLGNFQVIPIIELIKREYRELRLEEIAICFRNGVAGKYGPTMHRFDIEVISEWLKKYYESDERWDYIENRDNPIKNNKILTNSDIVEDLRNFVEGKEKEVEYKNPNTEKYLKEAKEIVLSMDKGDIYRRTKNSAIVSVLTLEIFTDRLLRYVEVLDKENLIKLKEDYERNKPKFYEEAIKIINEKLTL